MREEDIYLLSDFACSEFGLSTLLYNPIPMTSNNANPFSSAGRSGYSSISQGVNYDSEEEKPTKR